MATTALSLDEFFSLRVFILSIVLRCYVDARGAIATGGRGGIVHTARNDRS